MQGSHFLVIHILIIFLFVCHSTYGRTDEEKFLEQTPSFVDIGVVQDLNSPFGAMISLCMDIAISDFYLGHPNYKTRLRLHTKDARSTLDVDLAVLELLEHKHVHGVLGLSQQSTEDIFISELGSKVHVPIISFTARSSSLSNTDQNHYYVKTTVDDMVQTRALAAICCRFEWSEVVFFYEDTEQAYRFLSHLNKAFRENEIGLARLIAIPTSAKNNHIFKELSILNTKPTGVFLVHMSPSLGFRLFNLAEKLGMMSEGYAWIITDSLSNFLNSIDLVTRYSMEGVIGIRPYVHLSKDLENFQERYKNTMILRKNKGRIMDLNVYGLWAYDTITSLATALEKIGPINSTSSYVTNENVTIRTKLRVSSYGPQLLREFSNTKFRGLSGDFQLVDGKLKPLAFEIFNLIGTGEKRVGFWTSERGVIRELTLSSSTKELKKIVWPGDSIKKPKGWAVPTTGPLRVGVPWKGGYKEFVNVSIDSRTNHTEATGFAIDIFLAALKVLFPIEIDYKFYCYNGTDNIHWTYDDMLGMIPQDEYDMVVGDTTIWAPRAADVDFSLPYSESGVVLVVKNKKPFDIWIFTKPLKWDLWLAIALACIIMGIVILILERRQSNPAPAQEHRMNYLAPITVLAFQERDMVANNWSFFVLVCWLFMAFILMQSFTANLSAILTVDQIKFAFSEDYYIGYHEASFMKKFLIESLSIDESRLRGYSSVEGFHDAMLKGSKKGGIDAIFDEIPYMKLLVNQYYPQYKILPPTYRTDGLGFAFPIGSSLAANFSRAILNVTQGPEMTSIEKKNFGPGYSSQDPLSNTLSQGTSSLTFYDFAGLFIIVGSLTAFAVICAEMTVISRLTIIRRFVDNFFFNNNRGANNNVDEDRTNKMDDANENTTSVQNGEQENVEMDAITETVETSLNNEANEVQDTNNRPARNF